MIRQLLKQRRQRQISDKLAAIEELLKHLEESDDSLYSGYSVIELIQRVEAAKSKLQSDDLTASRDLWPLLVPTGPLQETAIDNGWADQFLIIANRLD